MPNFLFNITIYLNSTHLIYEISRLKYNFFQLANIFNTILKDIYYIAFN